VLRFDHPLRSYWRCFFLLLSWSSISLAQEHGPPRVLTEAERETATIRQETQSEIHGEERTVFGPFAIEGAGGEDLLSIHFASQLRLQAEDEAQLSSTNVSFARLRPALRGGFMEGKFSYVFQMNLSPGAAELIDLFGDYRFNDRLRFLVGQHKIYLTRYRSQSFSTAVLIDWGDISRWHGAERQIGAAIHNHAAHGKELQYSLGVYTGQNRRAAFANRLPGVYGEPLENPSALGKGSGLETVHPEVVGAASYKSKDMFTGSLSSTTQRNFRWMTSLSGAYDFRPELAQDATARLAPEFMMKWKGLGLSGIYYFSWTTLSDQADQLSSLGYHGPQFTLSYRFNQTWEVSARYGGVFVNKALRDDARQRADNIIVGAPLKDRIELEAQYARAGTQVSEQEFSLGVTSYIIGNSLKFQCDASYLPRTDVETRIDNLRLRAQLQLAF